jgi:hypothetical protein
MRYTMTLPLLLLSGAAFAQDGRFDVVAAVVEQTCLGPDRVVVELTAHDNAPNVDVLFRWDRQNDRDPDANLSPDPAQAFRYPDETEVTARVYAITEFGERASGAVTFTTISCP